MAEAGVFASTTGIPPELIGGTLGGCFLIVVGVLPDRD